MKSIVTKIFTAIYLALFVMISVQIFILVFFFPKFYENSVNNSIEQELSELFIESSTTTFVSNLENFSLETQTSNLLLSDEDLSFQNESSIILTAEVLDLNNNKFTVLLPRYKNFNLKSGDTISGGYNSLKVNTGEILYYPNKLLVNDIEVYNNKKQSDLSIRFTVTKVLGENTTEFSYNRLDTFQNEIFNFLTTNYDKKTDTLYGYKYNSKSPITNSENITYISNIVLGDNEYTLLTAYSLDQINSILGSFSTLSIYTNSFTVIALFLLMNRYLKWIRIPLLNISKACKKIANLDFSDPLPVSEGNDEIAQISRSINNMSISLQNSIEELGSKNMQISRQMEKESFRDNLRKDFVAGLSHEIKTPLAVIKASFEGIANGVFEGSKLEEQYEIISDEIDKTTILISNMMKAYEVDTPLHEQSLTKFNLKDVILKVDSSLSILAESKEIITHLDLYDSEMYGDSNKMELVVSNLYSNAIKYTLPDENIYIKLENDGYTIKFSITNTGVTIPEDSIGKIFEPFYRVNVARERKSGSVGLGLYIVKQIADQFDYVLNVENVDNSVKFTITIDRIKHLINKKN